MHKGAFWWEAWSWQTSSSKVIKQKNLLPFEKKFGIPIKGKWKKVKIEIASLHLIKIVWKKTNNCNTKFHREVIKTSNWIVWNEDQMIQQVFSKRLTKDVLTAKKKKKILVKLWRLDWQVNSDKKNLWLSRFCFCFKSRWSACFIGLSMSIRGVFPPFTTNTFFAKEE